VHGKRLDGSKFPNISEWIDYDGEVFCAEVPNHLLIVRRNGKIIVSGNSMAGTVLRRAMTNLMSPTGGMADLIYELGLNIYDTTGRMRPFIEIMGQISDRLDKMTDEYKNMVFEVLFGRRAIAGQIVLFNYGSEALRKYANEIKNAGGTTERVAKKQMKAFTEVLGQLWREMQRLAIVTGDTLALAIERLGNNIREKLVPFREYVKANKEAVATAMKWTMAIGALLLVGGPVLLIITSLITKMVGLAAVIANPWIVLIASLYTLRAVWKQTSEEMIGKAKEIVRAIAYRNIGGAGIVLGTAGMGAIGGAIVGGPVGAGIGGAVGLGLGMFEARDAKKVYQTFVKLGKKPAIDFREIWGKAFEDTKKQMVVDFGDITGFIDDKLGNTEGL